MTYELALIIAAIIVLLALSALFNASETALTAASRARMHAMEQEGNPRASLVNRLMAAPEKMLGAVLLGNTLVDVLAAALASAFATKAVGEVGVIYAAVIMTSLIVIFSAVLPKTYALASSDRAALVIAPFMRAIIWVLTPFTILLQVVVRALLKLTPRPPTTRPTSSPPRKRSAAPSSCSRRKVPWRAMMPTCSAVCSISAISRSRR